MFQSSGSPAAQCRLSPREAFSCSRFLNNRIAKQKSHNLLLTLLFAAVASAADTLPPSAPIGLTATAVSCGQINLSWTASVDEVGGSGLKAYTISRSEGAITTIGAARTWFSDTNYVKSSTTVNYNVFAIDNAGNQSAASNSVTVTTPPCPMATGESVVDSSYTQPLGKKMATFGSRTAVIYHKQNVSNSTLDTWLYVNDSDTGQTSRFLLHAQPSYYQTETDYVLTSATELWTLSCDVSMGGNLVVSQYRLNGSPPTSATLVSTKALGDNNSMGMSMIRLQSGALVVAWNQEGWGYRAYDLTTGYAYRSPAGNWSVKYPITVPNSGGGNIVMSSMTMAQHPADHSVWAFIKRDSFTQISALHFTETANDILLDWINTTYITQDADGDNGPEGEFPSLAAVADPTRNLILLGYQNYHDRSVFTDPVYGSMNSIFLKEAYATVAQIRADGTKSFIPFRTYMERCIQFGLSLASDGAIWLAYQPINSQTLTWNEVYTSKYQAGVWSAPALVGFNYQTYNVASGSRNPGVLIYRVDQPKVAFMTPDRKVHSFSLSDTALPPPPSSDTTPPLTAITSPTNGATVSGVVSIAASASDNVGVTAVEFLVDGSVVGTATSAPYSFPWDTASVPAASHTLQSRAFDASGNSALSAAVAINVSNATSTLAVAITNPKNGANVPRNQTVSIGATATGTAAVTKVEFYINNSLVATDTSAPYSHAWKVPARKASHSIQARGYDVAGNVASQTITVTAQ